MKIELNDIHMAERPLKPGDLVRQLDSFEVVAVLRELTGDIDQSWWVFNFRYQRLEKWSRRAISKFEIGRSVTLTQED